MKKLSEQQLAWFKGLQTEKKYENNFHFLPDDSVKWTRSWFMGISSIMVSVLLSWFSFSPVWGNPGEEVQSKDVLIPINELMNGEEKVIEQPQSDLSESQSSDERNQLEKQESRVEEEHDQRLLNVENNRSKSEDIGQLRSNFETKNNESLPSNKTPSRNESPSSTVQRTTQTKEQVDSTSDVRTENGGKLPKTATPFGTYFLRGLALVLLGIGIRLLNRDRLQNKMLHY